jgi:hypothetical protein
MLDLASHDVSKMLAADDEQHIHALEKTVSTVEKSQATIPAACWCRNDRQGDRACVEYWARFLDQQGTAMTLAGCDMARFDADGLITKARDYWHLQEGHQSLPDRTVTYSRRGHSHHASRAAG